MARNFYPVHITRNKQNMWAKRKLAKQKEVEEAFLQ